MLCDSNVFFIMEMKLRIIIVLLICSDAVRCITCMVICRGCNIFGNFEAFLESDDPDDGTEQALLDELEAFDEHIRENVRDQEIKTNPLK